MIDKGLRTQGFTFVFVRCDVKAVDLGLKDFNDVESFHECLLVLKQRDVVFNLSNDLHLDF